MSNPAHAPKKGSEYDSSSSFSHDGHGRRTIELATPSSQSSETRRRPGRRTYKAVSMLLGSAAILFAVSAIMLMVSDEPTNWDEREYTEGDLTISSGLHVNDITVGV